MTNIAAAIGLAQLERIERHLETRRAIATGYNRRLGHLSENNHITRMERWAKHVYWMYTILLRNGGQVSGQCNASARRTRHETRPGPTPCTLFRPIGPPRAAHIRAPISVRRAVSTAPWAIDGARHGPRRRSPRLRARLTNRCSVRIVLASSFVPFVNGGGRFIVEWLEQKLLEQGHRVERFYIPLVDRPEDLFDQILAYRLIDLADSCDRLIDFDRRATYFAFPTRFCGSFTTVAPSTNLWDSPYRIRGGRSRWTGDPQQTDKMISTRGRFSWPAACSPSLRSSPVGWRASMESRPRSCTPGSYLRNGFATIDTASRSLPSAASAA